MSRKLKPVPKLSVARKEPPSWRRHRNISLAIRIAIPLVILLTALLVGIWAYDNYVAVWHQRIVKINDTTIDMDYYVKMMRFNLSTVDSFDSYQDMENYANDVVDKIENRELLRQRASKLGISATPEEVDDWIEEFLITSYYGDANISQIDVDIEDLYDQLLKAARISDSEYRSLAEIDVLNSEITEYFRENEVPAEGEHVYLHAIITADELQAGEAYDRIQEGGNFTAVAAEFSVISEVQDSGGVIGWVPRGYFPDEVDEVAFNMEIGNISEVIATSQGYYIIQITDKEENRPLTEEFIQYLTDGRFEEWFQAELESSTIIEYLNKDKIDFAFDQIF